MFFLQNFEGRGEVDLDPSLAAVRLIDWGESGRVEAGRGAGRLLQ